MAETILCIASGHFRGDPGVSEPFLIANINVPKIVTLTEVNLVRAIGLVEDGIAWTWFARRFNQSRTTVDYW